MSSMERFVCLPRARISRTASVNVQCAWIDTMPDASFNRTPFANDLSVIP